MIKTGKQGTILTVYNVHHELAKDQEVMNFTVFDTYTDINGKQERVYYKIKSWEDVPLVEGQQIRIAYITRVQVDENYMRLKKKDDVFLIFTAKIEKIS